MKYVFILVSYFILTSFSSFGQNKSKTTNKDSAIAEKKPEDKIQQYWFVVLKTGPKNDFDSATRSNLFKGHMDNIKRLYKLGKLKVAGPFGKNDNTWRGLFILDCETKDEAETLAKTDPAVAAGIFIVDIVPWYTMPTGSFKKGIPEKLID